MMTRVQSTFDELQVLVNCVMVLAKIAYLHVEDLTIFIVGGVSLLQYIMGRLKAFPLVIAILGLGKIAPICIFSFVV